MVSSGYFLLQFVSQLAGAGSVADGTAASDKNFVLPDFSAAVTGTRSPVERVHLPSRSDRSKPGYSLPVRADHPCRPHPSRLRRACPRQGNARWFRRSCKCLDCNIVDRRGTTPDLHHRKRYAVRLFSKIERDASITSSSHLNR